MIIYSLLILTLLTALASILVLSRKSGQGITFRWHRMMFSVSSGAFIYLYGTWVFLSVYARYLFAICFAISFIVSLLRKKTDVPTRNSRIKVGLYLVFTIIFSGLSVLYFTGTTGKPYGIARLALPFKKGTYFVFQGGKGLPTNIFHYGLRGAVYAMDIIKLNGAGNRAKHIFSRDLEDYEIFNDTLYSPCSGVVRQAVADNPDNIPPNRKRGPHNTNNVLIATDSFYVFMGHLKHNCVFVHEGDSVQVGQPLACIGNSGFSLEPHLHIQVHAKTDKDVPWYKQPPLLIAFDGRSYLLFEKIEAPPWPSPNGREVLR